MLNEFSRTELLIGKEAMQRLYGARVAVFGIGGVGGYVVEALARSGVGAFDLIDDDKVCLTNINRQIIATRKTIGKYKVDVMEERVHSINPEALVTVHKCFYLPETATSLTLPSMITCGCGGYCDCQAGDHYAGEGSAGSRHQLYGSRQ